MAVKRAIIEYMDEDSSLEDAYIIYKPRSDFINLTKLIGLVIIKKQEENKEEESKRAATFRSWVWEK